MTCTYNICKIKYIDGVYVHNDYPIGENNVVIGIVTVITTH